MPISARATFSFSLRSALLLNHGKLIVVPPRVITPGRHDTTLKCRSPPSGVLPSKGR